MPRFSVGYRTTAAATALLPMASIYATAAVQPRILEVGVFNTTATEVAVSLARLSTAGTSSAVTPTFEDDDSQTAVATPRNTHSSTGPTIGVVVRACTLGAAKGSGVIWTFGDRGIIIAPATGNGLGLYTPTGTGQICDVYWVWEE